MASAQTFSRGLTVVAAHSDRWGSKRTGHSRKVVWAELAR
jgi:hypothetical protein